SYNKKYHEFLDLLIIIYNHISFHIIFLFTYIPTTQIYTLSLHDALPIFEVFAKIIGEHLQTGERYIGLTSFLTFVITDKSDHKRDRKSTRLNSSHVSNSYAVFCLKKKTDNNAEHYNNALSGIE